MIFEEETVKWWQLISSVHAQPHGRECDLWMHHPNHNGAGHSAPKVSNVKLVWCGCWPLWMAEHRSWGFTKMLTRFCGVSFGGLHSLSWMPPENGQLGSPKIIGKLFSLEMPPFLKDVPRNALNLPFPILFSQLIFHTPTPYLGIPPWNKLWRQRRRWMRGVFSGPAYKCRVVQVAHLLEVPWRLQVGILGCWIFFLGGTYVVDEENSNNKGNKGKCC